MHQLFTIPELLSECMYYVETNKALSMAARVCRVFRDAAVPVLWSELDSIIPLLLLLGLAKPIFSTNKEWCFVMRPGPDEFATFYKYSGFVRDLVISHAPKHKDQPIQLALSVFSTVALAKPPGKPLLPALESLTILPVSPQQQLELLPWLSPTLTEIQMDLGIVEARSSALFLRELPLRCPKLVRLDIMSKLAYFAMEEGINGCVSNLPVLQEIVLPWGYIQNRSVASLAGLPSLRKIRLRGDVQEFLPNMGNTQWVSQTRFRALEHLSLYTTLSSASALAAEGCCTPALKTLEISSRFDAGLQDLPKFFESISTSQILLRSLTAIRLDLRTTQGAELRPVTFDYLRPLLSNSNIRRFFIRHHRVCALSEVEIQTLLTSWPELVELSLCADPETITGVLIGNPTPPSLNLLYVFATYGKNLQDLGMYFDTSIPPNRSFVTQGLENMVRLHVGASSPPKDIFSVALLLGDLCHRDMVIECGEHKIPPYTKRVVTGPSPSKVVWEEVERQFREIAKVRDRAVDRQQWVKRDVAK